mmetsp:Transcript_38608/g.111390  ORF Transcript_38608/g.111390 Transcript_38608/m.111390 type:complete len:237 (-) Transcript_38608:444-1154(-)
MCVADAKVPVEVGARLAVALAVRRRARIRAGRRRLLEAGRRGGNGRLSLQRQNGGCRRGRRRRHIGHKAFALLILLQATLAPLARAASVAEPALGAVHTEAPVEVGARGAVARAVRRRARVRAVGGRGDETGRRDGRGHPGRGGLRRLGLLRPALLPLVGGGEPAEAAVLVMLTEVPEAVGAKGTRARGVRLRASAREGRQGAQSGRRRRRRLAGARLGALLEALLAAQAPRFRAA